MVQRGIQTTLIGGGEAGLREIFGDTLEILRRQDLLIGNLEGAVSRRGSAIAKSYNFRFRPEVLEPLKSAGFDYFSLTNNHAYDYGEIGFVDSLQHLSDAGLATSGAGMTPQEAYRPYRTKIGGTTVKVLSVAAYPREKNGFDGRTQASVREDRAGIIFDGPETTEAIRSFSTPNAIDIVVAHGGREWSSRPSESQISIYRGFIDAGADLVLAHHPHVLQGMERYRGGLIAYSLGNFLFPGMGEMRWAEDTLILSLGFLGSRLLYIEPFPVEIDHRVVSLERGQGEILERLMSLSRELSTGEN